MPAGGPWIWDEATQSWVSPSGTPVVTP
jgi:hypothetical protein